jgi:hypothetical protein
MTIRTFKQRGQAHGILPVTVAAKIDGVEVFNGVVPTLNTPYQITGFDQDVDCFTLGDELFSWTDDASFSGTKTLEISVSDGYLVLMNTMANYLRLNAEDAENQWSFVYYNRVDDVIYTNPWSNMTINDQAQNPNTEILGQTYWLLPPGSVMTCTVNITASMGATAPG